MFTQANRLLPVCQSAITLLILLLLAGCSDAIRYNHTGNSNYDRGEYDRAVQAYQRAQVASPDEAEAYFNAAAAFLAQGAADSAIPALQQALKTADEPLAAAAFYNLGNAYYQVAEYNEAVEAYQQALRLRPDDEAARYNLELALLNALPPSPTALEQQTFPDSGETDPTVTPTNQPGGFDGPTPSPPPQELDPSATPGSGEGAEGNEDSATPVPLDNGQMTVKQAAALLDQVTVDQHSLSEYMLVPVSSGQPTEKDW